MRASIWGCRGSLASPGPDTVRYGGNTSCVEVRLSDDSLLVLDAGTGIRPLGVALGSVGPTILRAPEAEKFAEGLIGDNGWENALRPADSARQRFGELVAQAARPIDDVRGTAAYRSHTVAVMAARALERTCASA